jgi:hypothetical protein
MPNDFVRSVFPEMAKAVDEGKCPFCDKVIDADTEFRDQLSIKEFNISGLCQSCQDGVFHD